MQVKIIGTDTPGSRHQRSSRRLRRVSVGGVLVAAGLVATACSSSSTAAPTSPNSASSSSASGTAMYQLHMKFFSTESKISPVIDPQVFVSSPGAKAAIGPQMIKHVAGVAPARMDGAASTPLLAADGTPLKITLGQWEKAAGAVELSCRSGSERAASRLTGLIPRAHYSTFVVHLKVQGAGRFTPWGNSSGTNNNFTASSSGTASPTNTVPGCLGSDSAIVIIWHSDGTSHGATPGVIGVTWHNSVITPLP